MSVELSRSPPSECKKRKEHGFCQVCGDVAAGTYFGAKVCIPCKAFFIRSTSEKTSVFECPGDRKCKITVMTRTTCKFCRFQNCLRAGMTRKERLTEDENTQLVCVICGDDANGVHFGALTCEGCKKFYRRGLLVGEAKSYVCKADKQCEITARTRNNCRYCRFQKCIRMGMSRDAIQMGRPSRYQKPKFMKNALVLRRPDIRDMSDGEHSSRSTSSGSETPPTFAATTSTPSSVFSDAPPLDQKPPAPPAPFPGLLSQALEVCHTDLGSLGIGQAPPHPPRAHQAQEAPSSPLDPFFDIEVKQEADLRQDQDLSASIDLSAITASSEDQRSLVEELNAQLPPPDYCNQYLPGSQTPSPSKAVEFAWPSRLSPTIEEIEATFRRSYWQTNQSTNELILSEEHQTAIDLLVYHYKQSMIRTELAQEQTLKELEVLCKDPMQQSLASSVKSSVARYIESAMVFFVNIPGFHVISKADQLLLVRSCSSQFRILMAALNWFDARDQKFTNNFYPFIPLSERTDFGYYQHLLELARKVHPMNIDSIEEALLATLVFVASDYFDIQNASAIEEIRLSYITVLSAYITAKYGSNDTRLNQLLSIVPYLRVLSMEHAMISRRIIVASNENVLKDVAHAAPASARRQETAYERLMCLDIVACI